MDALQKRSWLAWASVGVLAVLCASLALLQNHWIGEVSRAERERLQQQLQSELSHLSREFNNEIAAAVSGLIPPESEIEQQGREKAYASRYAQRQSRDRVLGRIALAVPQDHDLEFLSLDRDKGDFLPAPWPAEWSAARAELTARMNGEPVHAAGEPSNLITIPRFGAPRPGGRPGPAEQEWLVVEVNIDYVRATLLPELLHRYLSTGGKLDYQAQVVENADPSKVIFQTDRTPSSMLNTHDAAVPLLDGNYSGLSRSRGQAMRGPGPGPPGGRSGPPRRFERAEPGPGGPGGPPPPGGRWRLLVRHEAGSLEAVVAKARWQNLATSLGILLLILATVATLVRFSRRAQRLAAQQMNFVAGVSHELRTPLTVIRTAAFNLRGKIAAKPEQVERYASLIQNESEKLEALVEQVLHFSSAEAGHAIRSREQVAIETVIEEGLQSSQAALAASQFVIEKKIEPDLPMVLADRLAMKHVFQNLVENAIKYGTEGSNWIGVSAARAPNHNGESAVEIRVADHGPGIPEEEQRQIFDPFFRGRRAVEDQVHGTGLGLNLAKQIVEAHGGAIRVNSQPGDGAEFVIVIPAAPTATTMESTV